MSWREHAACRGADLDEFFPTATQAQRGRGMTAADIARPIAEFWCSTCPVRGACGEEADRLGDIGIWGGFVRWQRGNSVRRINLLDVVEEAS